MAASDTGPLTPTTNGEKSEKRSIPLLCYSEIVILSLRATGNAPQLRHKKFAVDKDKTMSWVIQWLAKTLKCEEGESFVSHMTDTSRDDCVF